MSMDDITKRKALFSEHVNAPDPLQIIIRGQLHIEAELVELISDSIAVVRPEVLELDDWSYTRKLEMAAALGLIATDVIGSYKALNSLRNKIAHDLSIQISEKHARDLYNSFSPFFRYLYGAAPENFVSYTAVMRRCMKVMWVHLNKAREKQEELKKQMQRDHEEVIALLDEEAKRTTPPTVFER